jgi:hypothetical protein
MVQSTMTRSGRSSRALFTASTPLSTIVTMKSSCANTMPMTLRMVMESSATTTLLGISMLFRRAGRTPGTVTPRV